MSLLFEIRKLPSPNGSKEFLSSVKKILQDFKALSSSEPENGICSNLTFLVQLYLRCPCRLPAKRAMASFFQGLEHFSRQEFERQMCRQLKECMNFASITEGDDTSSMTTRRHCVDNINSLMENFKLGEKCLFNIFLDVITFLVQAEAQFLSRFGPEVPPVDLNEIMLNCHVTMQTINLILQKTNAESSETIISLQSVPECLNDLMNLNIQVIHNDLFLLDCRCCCAMNAILLLQLTLPMNMSVDMIPSILLPRVMGLSKTDHPAWLSDTQIGHLSLDSTKPLTFLALTFGYVAMVTASGIVHKPKVNGKYFFTDILLPQILHVGTSCEDTPSKALYAKTVNLWTSRLLLAMDQAKISGQLASKLKGGSSETISSLLDYVWTHWEDTLAVVHQSCKTVFENTLKLHVKACSAIGEDSGPFILSIVDKVLAVSWTSRGKSSALISCVNYIGTNVLLHLRPSLPDEVLQQLQEQAMSCYASELFSCLFLSHQQEISSSLNSKDSEDICSSQNRSLIKGADMDEDIVPVDLHHRSLQTNLMETWIHPIIKAMLSTHSKWKQSIIEYLLPKLLKNNSDVLDFMIKEMSSTKGIKSDQNLAHGAIIMCLRRARVIGLLKFKSQTSSDDLWFGILHRSILQSALCNLNEQIRLDAFALLCENCKTSEAISSFEFEMLQSFIPYNVNSQSPAFRQTFLSLMKKLFFRLKESLGLLNRQTAKKNASSSVALIKTYHSFLSWLTLFLLDNIYPGSSFAQRMTCLACLSLLTSFFTSAQDGFSVPGHLSQDHLQKFLECLSDTFEENKKEALGMLTIYTNVTGPIGTPKRLETLFSIAFGLTCSTKPQDCESAAYLFNLLLKQPTMWQILREYHLPLQSEKMKLKLELINSTIRSSALFSPDSEEIACTSRQLASSLYLLDLLCLLLDDQIEQAQKSLVTAAASRPMYSTLHCIRYVIKDIDWTALASTLIPFAKRLINSLINSCLELAKVVSPVVQNSSPEGNVPADAILHPGLNMSDLLHSLDIKDSDKATGTEANRLAQSVALSQMLVEAMPEYLVVCCWRSIKEVSLVLGKLCLQIPIVMINENSPSDTVSDSNSLPFLLSLDQIETIGQYFTHQLLESIHRGAFELAYTGFQLMCQMLWSHPSPAFHKLPPHWLQQVLTDIQSPQSKLCATRRSAGVPFFVQAITSTEPSAVGRKCFHGCIKELLLLATEQMSVTDERRDAKVHALNILRTLYRDAKLGEEVVPYIAEGLKAAILGFKSDLWAVRNSSTLLLSSLMTRIFGVKRSKDEGALSKKNCQTGRAFFHRYPSLYPFLLNELENATASVGQQDMIQLHPSLYPILLVLGRLFPSTLEGSDTSLSLSAFIPFVLKCSTSPVYKTRVIAARALQPLVRNSQVTDILEKLLDTIQSSALHHISSSHIHGSLLQLQQLFQLVFGLNDTLKEKAISAFASKFRSCSWLLSPHNTCCATHQDALKLVDSALDIAKSVNLPKGELQERITKIELAFILSLMDSPSKTTLPWKPFFYELEKTRARLCVKHLLQFAQYDGDEKQEGILLCGNNEEKRRENDESEEEVLFTLRQKVLKDLLTSPFYEARLAALNGMLVAFETQPQKASVNEGSTDNDNIAKDGLTAPFIESEERGTEWEDECEDVKETSSKSSCETKVLMTRLSVSLFDSILAMAMEHEDHHECVEKLFCLLAAIPDCSILLHNMGRAELMKVFISVIQKLEQERRTEVKAAMLKFSSKILPLVVEMRNSAEDQQAEMEFVLRWIKIQTGYSRDDSNPDLQLSVSFSFLENSMMLLRDPSQKLGEMCLLCWDVVAILLQAEEPEVKNVAAAAAAVACDQHADAFHPNYALHKLPEFLVSFQSHLGFHKLFRSLVSWILLDESQNEKEIEERLFERGEINTYWDQISFSRSVAKVLVQLIQNLQNNSNSWCSSSSYKSDMTKLKNFAEATTAKYVHDLELLKEENKIPDAFTNPGKFTGVYVTVYCAEHLRQIFKKCHKCLGIALPSQYLNLEDLIVNVKEKMHVICQQPY